MPRVRRKDLRSHSRPRKTRPEEIPVTGRQPETPEARWGGLPQAIDERRCRQPAGRLVLGTTTSGQSARGGVLHRPGGPQANAPGRGRRVGRGAAARGEAAAATGVWEVHAETPHGRALSKRTAAAAAHRSDSGRTRPRTAAAAHRHACTCGRRHACSFIEAAAGSAHTPSAKATAVGQQGPRGRRPRRYPRNDKAGLAPLTARVAQIVTTETKAEHEVKTCGRGRTSPADRA
jgi:hypothetical protein